MFPDTPKELLRRMAVRVTGEDDVAWAQFVDMYVPVMRTYFLAEKGVTSIEADDLVQDLLVRLMRVVRTGGYDAAKSRFRTFLTALMRHILIDRHRRRVASHEDQMVPLKTNNETIVDEGPDVSVVVDMRWRVAVRSTVIRHVFTRTAVSPLYRDIYRAYVMDGEKASVVARRLGVTEDLVRQVKVRMNQMIEELEKHYLL